MPAGCACAPVERARGYGRRRSLVTFTSSGDPVDAGPRPKAPFKLMESGRLPANPGSWLRPLPPALWRRLPEEAREAHERHAIGAVLPTRARRSRPVLDVMSRHQCPSEAAGRRAAPRWTTELRSQATSAPAMRDTREDGAPGEIRAFFPCERRLRQAETLAARARSALGSAMLLCMKRKRSSPPMAVASRAKQHRFRGSTAG